VPAAVLVDDINPSFAGSGIHYFAQVGGELYFTANDGTHGVALWKTNGTSAGTAMVDDFNTLPVGLRAAAVDAIFRKH
jgi:ELWxxDGT repeat protein